MGFQKAISTFQEASRGNWFTNIQDLKSIKGAPCGFYTYNPKTEHCTAGFTDIASFNSNCESMNKKPIKGITTSDLAGLICELHQETVGKQGTDAERDLGFAMHLYMIKTKSGQLYLKEHKGIPFSFISILYPADKKSKHFNVRPFIVGANGIKTVEELKELSKQVMQIDLKNHPEYFKYL